MSNAATNEERLVEWRYTWPPSADGMVGLGFNLADSSVLRLRLSVEDAALMTGSVEHYLRSEGTPESSE